MPGPEDTRFNKSSYAAEYGMCETHETISGHQWQVDNTPGKERLFLKHGSGTMVEINFDGNKMSMTIGDCKDYNKGGYTSTTDENSDTKTIGHQQGKKGGANNLEISGDLQVAMGGDTGISGMKNVNLRAKSIYIGSDTNINMRGSKDIHIKADGAMLIEAQQGMTLQAKRIDLNPSAPGGGSPFVAQAGFPNKSGGNSVA